MLYNGQFSPDFVCVILRNFVGPLIFHVPCMRSGMILILYVVLPDYSFNQKV